MKKRCGKNVVKDRVNIFTDEGSKPLEVSSQIGG